MFIKTASLLRSILRPLLVTGLLTCLLATLLVVVNGVQTKKARASEKVAMRERIATIIRDRLSEEITIVNGVRVQTRVPPSKESIEEIRHYGDTAVLTLSDYLSSKNSRERTIAVEFLGLLGGRRIINPLQQVIRNDGSPTIRIIALRWLTQAPWDLAVPIIHEAATRDPNKKVREVAQSLLGKISNK